MEERQVSVDGVTAAAAGPVPRRRHPEPGRVRRHLPAARGAARPVPAQGDPAAARARRGAADPAAGTPTASTRATSPRPACGRSRRRPTSRPRQRGVRRRAGRRPRWWATSSTSPGPPASRRRCRSASVPAGATALLRDRRAWAWLSGRDFVTPDDVKALARADPAPPARAAARGRARGRRRRRRCWRRALGSVPVPR